MWKNRTLLSYYLRLLCQFYRKNLNMKGSDFETFVRLLEESFKDSPDTTVRQNVRLINVDGKRREFDVVVDSTLNGHTIRIAIECKDYKGKVAVEKVEAFKTKCDSVPSINVRVFVSKNGFQSGVYDVANRYGISLHMLSEMDSQTVDTWVQESGYQLVTSQMEFTFGLGYVSQAMPNIQSDTVFHFDGIEDGGIPLPVVQQVFYNVAINQVRDIGMTAYNEAARLKYSNPKVTFELFQSQENSRLYVIDQGVKEYIQVFRLGVKIDFLESFLRPDFSGSYQDMVSATPKGVVHCYKGALKGKEITVVKGVGTPNQNHIYISGLNGNPMTIEDAPIMFLPQGLDFTLSHPELEDLLIRRGGRMELQLDETDSQ